MSSLNFFDYTKNFKSTLRSKLQEKLLSGEIVSLLNEEGGDYDDVLEEKISSYEKSVLRKGTSNSKTGAIHKEAYKTAKAHFLAGNSLEAAIKKSKEEHSLEEGFQTTDVDWLNLGEEEKNAVLILRETARQLGSDEGVYSSGVFLVTFTKKQAAEDYTNILENNDSVDTYEIEAYTNRTDVNFDTERDYDLDELNQEGIFFNVFVYLVPDIVLFPVEDFEIDSDTIS